MPTAEANDVAIAKLVEQNAELIGEFGFSVEQLSESFGHEFSTDALTEALASSPKVASVPGQSEHWLPICE